MKRKARLIGVIAVCLVLVSGLVGALFLPRLSLHDNSALTDVQLSYAGYVLYLWKSDYLSRIKALDLIFTDEVQKGYSLKTTEGSEVVSMWMENTDAKIKVYIQYGQETFDDISNQPGWFDKDVYAGICLALESKTLGWQGCRQQVSEYYEWTQQNHLPGIIKQDKGFFGFQLVKPAYAACSGTIICGKEVWVKSCVGGLNSGESCYANMDCLGKKADGSPATCNGSWKCDLSAGSDLNCNAIPDQWNCNNNSKADRCAIGCNNWGSNYCNWGGSSLLS